MSYCMFPMLNKSKLLLLCLICSCSGEIQMENDLERLYSNSVVFSETVTLFIFLLPIGCLCGKNY